MILFCTHWMTRKHKLVSIELMILIVNDCFPWEMLLSHSFITFLNHIEKGTYQSLYWMEWIQKQTLSCVGANRIQIALYYHITNIDIYKYKYKYVYIFIYQDICLIMWEFLIFLVLSSLTYINLTLPLFVL